MIRASHPSNAKRGGVETLGVHVVNLSNLTECIICEVSIQNNKGCDGVYIYLQAKMLLSFKIFCQILKQF